MSPASDYLMLGVAEHGKLHFRFNLGNGEAVLVYNETEIDDGRWHRIKATRYIYHHQKDKKYGKLIFKIMLRLILR